LFLKPSQIKPSLDTILPHQTELGTSPLYKFQASTVLNQRSKQKKRTFNTLHLEVPPVF